MSDVDRSFRLACDGDERAFAEWMGRVERPIRRSLQPFARAVDAESVVQETLMRMWSYARERGHQLTGEDASLKFAIVMARNLARNEARRMGRIRFLPPEDVPELATGPAPPPDHGLRQAITECLEALARQPLKALSARLSLGHVCPDVEIAGTLGMTRNTFLQNIVRARRQLAACLEGKGVSLREYAS